MGVTKASAKDITEIPGCELHSCTAAKKMRSYSKQCQFVTIALVVTGGMLFVPIVLSQQSQEHRVVTIGPQPRESAICKNNSSLDVLSDTRGVDFGPYLTGIVKTIRKNWYDIVPEVARPPRLKEGTVVIQFAIKKDGAVSGIKYHVSSGDLSLDRAAWASVANSNRLPPLPSEFTGDEIALRFYFFYNPELKIFPAGPFVPSAGSTQQFSARESGGADTSVHWSLSGKACEHTDCGTISAEGMYTAPVQISRQINFTINAKQENAPFESACVNAILNPPTN